MNNIVPRVAAIHDISGFGRCSLTVIIPVMSSLGIQVCPLPTAVLSSHTGGFTDFEFVDLTQYLSSFAAHWKRLGLEFDCIYSGFLGSNGQFALVESFIDDFCGKDTLVVVDPVFADHGEIYQTYTPDMVENMRKLVKRAHIITPNFTEAAFLLKEEMPEVADVALIKDWLVRLSAMGPKVAVMTSVPIKGLEGQLSACAYSREDNRFWRVSCEYIPANYPGTGDTLILTNSAPRF